MQLILNNWPALASHSAALLVGFLFSNINKTTQTNQLEIKHDLIAFPIEKKMFFSHSIEKIDFKTKLILIESSKFNGNEDCFNLIDEIVLLQIKPKPIIGIKKNKKNTLLKLANMSLKNEIHIYPKSEWGNLKKCVKSARITYGK